MDSYIPDTPFTIRFVLDQIKNKHKGCDLKNLISYETKVHHKVCIQEYGNVVKSIFKLK